MGQRRWLIEAWVGGDGSVVTGLAINNELIDGYFQKIKQALDRLAVVFVFVDDEELLHIVLDGLPSTYDSFSFAIRSRSDVLSVEESNALLNAKERVIKKISNGVDQVSMAMVANFHSQGFPRGKGGRNYNQRGRGAVDMDLNLVE